MMSKITYFFPFLRFLFIPLFSCLPIRHTQSCGFMDKNFHGYSFFNEAIVQDNASARQFVKLISFDDVYNASFQQDSVHNLKIADENLREWKQKFCDFADIEDIRQIVYKSPVQDLESIRTATQSENLELETRLADNEFAEQLYDNRCLEAIDYLIFAKKCEPFVVAGDAWNNEVKDYVVMTELLETGKKSFSACKSPFIRLRYAFQVMRLAHYAGNYQGVLNLYAYFMPKIDKRVQSVVHYWVLSLKAGALKKLGQRIESAYLFSIVFQHCYSKRDAAMQGFSIQSDAEWQQCLTLCRNDDEKVTLYAMRGANDNAKAVEEMQLIYDSNPKNEHLESLLFGEIRKLERDLLGYPFNDYKERNKKYAGIPRQYAGEYAIRLHRFILRCAKENQVARPEIWRVADGYVELLRGDFYAAQRVFSTLKGNIKNEALQEQVEILEIAAKIYGFDNLSPAVENEVSEIMENPLYKKYKDLPDFLFDKLANFYEKNGMKGHAFRCHHKIESMRPNPQLDIIDDLLALCEKSGKNALERHFTSDEKGNSLADELWEMKGMVLLGEHKLEASLEAFRKVSNGRLEQQKFNPFGTRIKECIFCPAKDSSKFLNRREIVEKLIDDEYQAKADLEDGHKYLYRLGTAYYNMSYYGHAWGVMDHYRSGSAWHSSESTFSDEYVAYLYPFGNREQTDVSRAYDCLTRAYEIARTKDREMAVKAAFWAAKCAQKMYFTSKDFRQTAYGNIPNLPSDYKTYLKVMYNYADTDYYKNVIKECRYFLKYK